MFNISIQDNLYGKELNSSLILLEKFIENIIVYTDSAISISSNSDYIIVILTIIYCILIIIAIVLVIILLINLIDHLKNIIVIE